MQRGYKVSQEQEAIKKKINDLDVELELLSNKTFSCLSALIEILTDHGLVKPKEFQQYVEKHKREYTQLMNDVEFSKMMRQIKIKK